MYSIHLAFKHLRGTWGVSAKIRMIMKDDVFSGLGLGCSFLNLFCTVKYIIPLRIQLIQP